MKQYDSVKYKSSSLKSLTKKLFKSINSNFIKVSLIIIIYLLWDQKKNNATVSQELIERLTALEDANTAYNELSSILSLCSKEKIEMLFEEYNSLTEDQIIEGLQAAINIKNPIFLSTIKKHANCLAKCERFLLAHPHIPELKEILEFRLSKDNIDEELEPEEAIESLEHQNPQLVLAKNNNKDKQLASNCNQPKYKYWPF